MQERMYDVGKVKIYSLTNNHLNSFCLSLYVRAGCLYESSLENGISHLFEHVVFRNLKCKYDDFYGLTARHGMNVSAATYKEFIRFNINAPIGEFALACDVLCSIFDEINIPASELKREKQRVKAERRENDYRSSIDCFFDRIVWKDTELEKWRLERFGDLDRISQKQLNEFRTNIFTQDNFFIYLTGNVLQKDIDLLSEKLGAFDFPESKTEARNVVTVNREFFNRDRCIRVKDDYWNYIKIGFDIDCVEHSGGVLDLLYAALFKTDHALIFSSLSEENPLIYSYDSTLEVYDNAGNINFSFEVQQKDLEEALTLIVKILNDVKDGLFDYEASLKIELYQAMLDLDNADDLNWSMAYYNHILNAGALDYTDEFYGRFKVTKERMTAAARDIFRGNNVTVAIKGNKRKINTENIRQILSALDK